MLHHADRSRRLAAATALGRLGLAAADFAPTLEAAAKDEDAEVRRGRQSPATARASRRVGSTVARPEGPTRVVRVGESGWTARASPNPPLLPSAQSEDPTRLVRVGE